MVMAKKSTYGSESTGTDEVKMDANNVPPTTHTIRTADGYVRGVFLTQVEGKFGPSIKVSIKEGLSAGTYYINPKKGFEG